MNWLAHLLLSEPHPAFRIGNLLPDLVPMSALAGLPLPYLRGIECHRRIDAFTDSHAVFRRSVARFPAPFRRFGGIITDVCYDHLLARAWPKYSALPLEVFAHEIYASFDPHRAALPSEAWEKLAAMREWNLLCSYHSRDGVRGALDRIGRRLRRPFALGAAVTVLEASETEFQSDFEEFFPQLRAHIANA
jgi:acyl carrier protein phosphodiesterase